MQNDKLVSIVLPVYNGEKYLKQSIESVLNQTYENLELIIVNDNSTDSSLDIAKEFERIDSRVKVISNPRNLKLPSSLNNGFKNANGEYYTWTSDDNYYENNAIEEMVNYLESNQDKAMVCCNQTIIDLRANNNRLFKPSLSVQDMLINNYVGACFLYRKTAADAIGEYNPKKFLIEDYDYWLRMMLYGNIGHLDKNLYNYRMRSDSLSGTREKEVLIRREKILKEYAPLYRKKFKDIKIKVWKRENKDNLPIIQKLFSVRNEGNNKVIRILGIKIKFKRKNKGLVTEINYLEKYLLAKRWIEKYTINNKGIALESNRASTIYPEVTGYYIPTLLKFGDRKRAAAFGDYLLSIQNEDGSWNAPSGKAPYTFDTAQILKGLAALIENNLDKDDKYKNALIKGCDWILTMQRENGSIATPDYSAWGLPYGKQVPEAIHVYCLEPLRKTARMFGIPKYEECIQKALNYYLSQENLTDFNTLSHFNAYIIEGLIDIGEIKRAQRAMDLVSLHQRLDGSVSAYSFVDFVCSTGLLQYAICWYKLGEIEKADKAFDYVCKLQNTSGGWFGSYTVARDGANYFPEGEISWAVKYFLDAVYYRQKAKYNFIEWDRMWNNLDEHDERYSIIKNQIAGEEVQSILDLGCGKGRYTKNLVKEYPNKKFHCVDISAKLFNSFGFISENREGTILNIPYEDKTFDCVFLCEALEHCIDLDNAIGEIYRVLKPNGKVIIIDKNIKSLGQLELADFEQWFDEKELCKKLERIGFKAEVKSNLEYEGGKRDGLFSAWIGEKK